MASSWLLLPPSSYFLSSIPTARDRERTAWTCHSFQPWQETGEGMGARLVLLNVNSQTWLIEQLPRPHPTPSVRDHSTWTQESGLSKHLICKSQPGMQQHIQEIALVNACDLFRGEREGRRGLKRLKDKIFGVLLPGRDICKRKKWLPKGKRRLCLWSDVGVMWIKPFRQRTKALLTPGAG